MYSCLLAFILAFANMGDILGDSSLRAMSSRQIVDKGTRLFDADHASDSAYYYFSIVAQRYYADPSDDSQVTMPREM